MTDEKIPELPSSDLSETLQDQIRADVYQFVSAVAEGAARDIQNYATRISEISSRALATQDEVALDSLFRSARALAGLNKVRITNNGWQLLDRFLGTINTIGSAFLNAAAQGLLGQVAKLAPPSAKPIRSAAPQPQGEE